MPKGGTRVGAGRKPLNVKAMEKTAISLDEDSLYLINLLIQQTEQTNFSEAVRYCIRRAVTDRLGLNFSTLEKPAKPEDRIDF